MTSNQQRIINNIVSELLGCTDTDKCLAEQPLAEGSFYTWADAIKHLPLNQDSVDIINTPAKDNTGYF